MGTELTKKSSILDRLGAASASPVDESLTPERKIRVVSTAISGFGRSLKDLAEDAVVTLEPDLIDVSPFADRLEKDEPALALLTAAIESEGQKIPVLVRPHPNHSERYQLAYGHRRLLAARALNIKIRAFIRPLTDAELILEQGAENGGREALTWIERALFAEQMDSQGLPPKTIWTTLGVDKSGLSRMRSVSAHIPLPIIKAIGRAPNVGHPRWIELADALKNPDAVQQAIAVITSRDFGSLPSNARFLAVFTHIKQQSAKSVSSVQKTIKSADGKAIGTFTRTSSGHVLTLPKTEAPFSEWLSAKIPDLYSDFVARNPANKGG